MLTFDNVQHGMGGSVAPEGHLLDMNTVAEKLNEFYVGFSSDWMGTRLDYWAPRIDDFQGLYFLHKHICSMDRGWTGQWPTFVTQTALKRVPLHYALAHEDLPLVCLPPSHRDIPYEQMMDLDAEAMVEATMVEDVKTVGWAEVMHCIMRTCPWISAGDLTRILGVPMDWTGAVKGSPLQSLWRIAAKRGAVAGA